MEQNTVEPWAIFNFINPDVAAEELVARARKRIEAAIEQYKPGAVFGMFSGGHDSLTATYIASLVDGFTGAAHINTGIGVQQTRQFVYDTCREQGWKLLEYKASEHRNRYGKPDPQDYCAIVRKHGFPGPGQHFTMYARLKERQIRRLTKDFKCNPKDKILLVAGCRSQESQRRMRNTEPLQKEGCRIWVNPIHDFSKSDCNKVIRWAGLKRNEVVDLIHKSGECLCGAFAQPGELDELAMWFPEEAKMIRDLEAEVKPKFGWGWEGCPKKRPKVSPDQTELFEPFMPMCHNCLIGVQP